MQWPYWFLPGAIIIGNWIMKFRANYLAAFKLKRITGIFMFNKLCAAVIMTAAISGSSAIAAQASPQQCGKASWYALTSKTASGERMNPAAMTAAHRTLPLGTKIHVTNKANGKSLVVRINDRGPFIKGRVLDLSKGAASRLGFINAGHTNVCITPVK